MNISPLSVSFRGQYQEQFMSDNLSDDIKRRPRRLKPYLRQVAKHLPQDKTLVLSYSSEGLRVGHKSSKKFSKKSLLDSDISLKFSKPISQKNMLSSHTAEHILKVLPILLGKEKFEAINDKIHKEIDFPTPYHEFKFMQENYPDEDI